MGMIKKRAVLAALCLSFGVVLALVASSCTNNLLDVVKKDVASAAAGKVSITMTSFPTTGSTLEANASIVLTFSESMSAADLALTGDLGTAAPAVTWTKTTLENDTATLVAPAAFWPAGSDKTLIVNGKSASGKSLTEQSLSYVVSKTPSITAASNIATGATITAHEVITLTFIESMDTAKIAVSGDLAGGTLAWSTSAKSNDTLTISPPAAWWPAGSAKTLIVNGKSALGFPLTELSLSYTVFKGVCVSGSTGSDTANTGTVRAPFATIQKGIDTAAAKYGTAEVRVGSCDIASPYKAVCSVYNVSLAQAAVYVVNMVAGVSVYGGYASDFSSRNTSGAPSYIKDISTDAIDSSSGNPVRVINVNGSTITSATVIDGFTITLGAGGASSLTARCGIACFSGSPTINNVTIQGRGDSEQSFDAYGIYLVDSSAVISGCSIDPGSCSDQSWGINTMGSASITTPKIQNCIINAGKSQYTIGIYLDQNVNATISGNSINGGNWGYLTWGKGICIYLGTMNATNADLVGNVFTIFSTNHSLTYGVYVSDSSPVSDPHTLRNNDFNYNGNWYYIEKTTTQITSTLPDSHNIPTTSDGSHPIFYSIWGNHSTATHLP